MKKMLLTMLALLLCVSTASATILPATGVDEDFKAWTGIECTPAVILCQSISVYDERGDQGGKKVDTLRYNGESTIPVIESWDGWAKIYYSDGNKTGWVHNEYLLFDPAWYVCDESMAVYAYPDTMAPRVAWLARDAKLPIITQTEADGHAWVCVSLRGASGWIRKTPEDTVDETWFRPEMLADITGALLTFDGEAIYASSSGNADIMATLSELLTNAEDLGGEVSGCPFGATLELHLADGSRITIELATDSCCVYRVDGRDYSYARHLDSDEDHPENTVLLEAFDLQSWEDLYLPGNG